MNFIEIVGPSGIGKTTLLKLLTNEFRKIGVKRPADVLLETSILNLDFKSKYRFKSSVRNFPWAFPALFNIELIAALFDSFENSVNLEDYISLLNTHQMVLWKSNSQVKTKLAIQEYYLNLLLCHSIITQNIHVSKRYTLLDEGLLMNTRGISIEVLKALSPKSVIYPTIVIHCFADAELVLERRQKRLYERGVIDTMKTIEKSETLNNIQKRSSEIRNLIDFLASRGSHIIDTNMDTLDLAKSTLIRNLAEIVEN